MAPTRREWGHIVLSTDHVSVDLDDPISFLPMRYLLNKLMGFYKTYIDTLLGGGGRVD